LAYLMEMADTGQDASARLASASKPSSKEPFDVPLLVPPITFDFPSGSLSKCLGSVL